jgi:hypothetical protein
MGGEELYLKGEGRGGRGGGEDGGGHLPSSVGLLELHRPLIMVKDKNIYIILIYRGR